MAVGDTVAEVAVGNAVGAVGTGEVAGLAAAGAAQLVAAVAAVGLAVAEPAPRCALPSPAREGVGATCWHWGWWVTVGWQVTGWCLPQRPHRIPIPAGCHPGTEHGAPGKSPMPALALWGGLEGSGGL